MNITVLLASGELDTWDDVGSWQRTIDNALLVLDEDHTITVCYSPGMWMRVEQV